MRWDLRWLFFQADRLQRQPPATNFFVSLSTSSIILYMKRKKSQKSAFQPQTEIMSFGFFVMKCYALHSVLKSRKREPQKMIKYLKYFWGQKIHCERGYGGKNREREKKNHAIPNEEFGMPNLFHQSDRFFDQQTFFAPKNFFSVSIKSLLSLWRRA